MKVEMPGPTGTQQRFFTYDYRGLLIAERHPEIGASGNGLVEYLEYDARGHAHRKRAETADIRMTFDAAERVTEITDIEAVPNRPLKLFAYDGLYAPCPDGRCNGKLSASARYSYPPDLGTVIVTESYQYNGRGGRHSRRDRVISDSDVQSGGQSVFLGQTFLSTQTFDEFGDLSAVGYPCRGQAGACLATDRQRTVIYSRWNGMLSAVPNYASSITYQPNGLIHTVTHGEGSTAVLERWTADDWTMGRPKRIRALSAGGTELWSSGDYAYDGTGNIRQIGVEHYAYDSLNRLTKKTVRFGTTGYNTMQRGYDIYGNYLYTVTSGCGDNGPCWDTGVLPLAITGTTNRYADLTYDARGNVTADDLRAYSYDPLDMSTGLSMDGSEFRYIYTADDERIAAVERKLVSGTLRNITTWTLRGFDNLLLSVWTDDSTSGTREFSWKEDEIFRDSSLLANVTPSGTRHYTLDHLGSPRLVTNSTGQPLGTQNFDPFGGGGTSDGGALQFTGHERDTANLAGGALGMPDYMHARYYDSGFGRFLSVDPMLGEPLSPQAWNRYAYALNNPINTADPTGLKPCKIKLTGGDAKAAGVADGTEVDGECVEADAPTKVDDAVDVAIETVDMTMFELWGILGGANIHAGLYNDNPGQIAKGYGQQLLTAVPGGIGTGLRPLTASGSFVFVDGSAIAKASQAAFAGAEGANAFTVSAKHLAGAGGRYAKFAADVNPAEVIKEGLQSGSATFLPNGEGSFQVITNVGRVIGTRGETTVKIILDYSGKIWTAYPIR